jgi:hypothetical protein
MFEHVTAMVRYGPREGIHSCNKAFAELHVHMSQDDTSFILLLSCSLYVTKYVNTVTGTGDRKRVDKKVIVLF